MPTGQAIFILLPYIYALFTTIVLFMYHSAKKTPLTIKNALMCYLHYVPVIPMAIIALVFVKFDQYGGLGAAIFSFFAPIIYCLILQWRMYTNRREKEIDDLIAENERLKLQLNEKESKDETDSANCSLSNQSE